MIDQQCGAFRQSLFGVVERSVLDRAEALDAQPSCDNEALARYGFPSRGATRGMGNTTGDAPSRNVLTSS